MEDTNPKNRFASVGVSGMKHFNITDLYEKGLSH